MVLVVILFFLALALAFLCGGWLLPLVGWRGIFLFLAGLASLLLFGCWRHLGEILPVEKR